MAEQDAAPAPEAAAAPSAANAAQPATRDFDEVFPETKDFDEMFPAEPKAPVHLPSLKGTPLGLVAPIVNSFLPHSPEGWKDYIAAAPAGRIMSAFGQAFTGSGMTQEVVDALRPYGVGQQAEEAQAQLSNSFAQTLARGAVTSMRGFNELAAKAVLAIPEAAVRTGMGVAGVVAQTGKELQASPVGAAVNIEGLGRDVAGEIERRLTIGDMGAGTPLPKLPPAIAKARASATIGEGEAGHFGIGDTTAADVTARAQAAGEQPHEPAAVSPGAEAGGEPPVPAAEAGLAPDVHAIARQIDPSTFQAYDALAAKKESYVQWMRGLPETTAANIEAKPPAALADLDRQIAETEKKAGNAGARTRGKFEDQLAALHEQRADLLDDLVRDHPDMVTVRKALQETDYAMRDLAPQVSAAYREAEARMPVAESEVAPPEQVATSETVAPASLPPVPEGMTRFYHGADSAETLEGGGSRWLTPNYQYARDFRAGETPKQVFYVDVPNDTPGLVKAFDDEGTNMKAGFSNFNAPEEIARQLKPVAEGETPAKQAVESAPESEAAPPTAGSQATVDQLKAIADNVRAQLVKAGRDADVAAAEAQVVAAYYDTWSRRMNGVLGTAQEMFERDGFDVLGARKRAAARAREPELAQDKELSQLSKPEIQARMSATKARLDRARVRALDSARRMYKFKQDMDRIAEESAAAFRKIHEDMEASRKEYDRRWKTDPAFRAAERVKINEYFARIRRENETKARREYKPTGAGESSTTQGIDASGAFPVNEDGFVLSDKDTPVKFGDQKGAARWILDQGHKESRAQTFEVANHPSGDGFTVWERERSDAEAAANELAQQIDGLEQSRRGGIRHVDPTLTPLDEGRKIIRLLRNGDASTFLHETSHAWLGDLLRYAEHPDAPADVKADAATVLKWLDMDSASALKELDEKGRLTKKSRSGNEQWARGFERYLMEGRAPSKALADVFAKFKEWLGKIYQSVSALKSPITDDIRDVFDRLLSVNPERVTITPHERAATGMADAHEAAADTAAPGEAFDAADKVRGERHETVRTKAGEIAHELGVEPAAHGGGEAPRPGADGGGAAAEPDGGSAGAVPRPGAVGAGGSEAAPKGYGPPAEPKLGPSKESGLYAKVPKAPLRLSAFIKKAGGVAATHAGEVDGLPGGAKLVNKRNGQSLDDLARSAWEAGYFHENLPGTQYAEGGKRPTPEDLLRLLRDDMSGQARYSDFDREEAAAYENALNHNAEVDRLAAELQIDAKSLTYRQFWDTVAERMSAEQAAKEVASLDEAKEADLEAAEAAAKEWVESRGEAWEPDVLYADAGHFLETPELDRPREEGAGGPGERAGGAEQPGPAGTGAQSLQERGGQSGGGTGPGDVVRTTPITDATAAGDVAGLGEKLGFNPDVPFKTGKDGQDLAGNIRLENLAMSEDVRALMRAWAAGRDDLTDARYNQESYRYKLEVEAQQAILCDVASSLRAAEKVFAETGDIADRVLVEQWQERLNMVGDEGATLRAGLGRGLAAFRKMKGADQIMAELRGVDLFQMQQSSKLNATLRTPRQVARAAKRAQMSPIERGWDSLKNGIVWYYVNNLISGPITHAAYFVGAVYTGLSRSLIELPLAAASGAVREAIAGKPIERVHLRESLDSLFGLAKGLRDGLPAGWKAVKAGVPGILPGEVLQADLPWGARAGHDDLPIPGIVGRGLNMPSDIVTGIHTIGRAMHYESNKAERVFAKAVGEGLEPGTDAFNLRVADLDMNTPLDIMQAAAEHATHMMMMDSAKWGSLTQRIAAISNEYVIAKLAVPFVNLPMNLLHGGLVERTPLALYEQAARDNLAGKNGGRARDIQAGKIAAGVAVSMGVIALAAEGRITGAEPHDPKEAALWRMSGKQAYSVHLPFTDHWTPYRKWLGWYGPLVSMAANVYTAGEHAAEGDLTAAAKAMVFGFGEVVADESWSRGLSDFVEAIKSDGHSAEKYLRTLASNFVPFSVGQSQIAHLIDPYRRRAENLLELVLSKAPGGSQYLYPSRDVFGEPLPSHMIVTPTKINNDRVIKAMLDLEVWPRQVDDHIRGVKLTPQQYDDYARIAGRLAKQKLNRIVYRDGFASLPGHLRRKEMMQALSHARETARSQIIVQSHRAGSTNDIIKLAHENKDAERADFDER